jgi:Fe-S-cluster containining protein
MKMTKAKKIAEEILLSEVAKAKEMVAKERRFECQRCETCCSYKGLIPINEKDIHELAKYLKISESSFTMRYLQEVFDPKLNACILTLKTNKHDDPKNGCIFHFGSFCAIYNSCRADLCNVFPWNHFDLKKEEWNMNFISDKGTFWCQGIGKGREWSIDEIRQLKERYTYVGMGI